MLPRETSGHSAEFVGVLCVGDSLPAFAVALSVAGPLLHPAGMESGGDFVFRGHDHPILAILKPVSEDQFTQAAPDSLDVSGQPRHVAAAPPNMRVL